MAEGASRPRVFLDISIHTQPIGRLVVELFSDKAPRTCENFRAICTGEKSFSYQMSTLHRVIDEFMIQGGDITKGDGTGGKSIYGGEFEDENIGWRDIDAEGLLCMANRGKDTNTSQFFITLAPCEHLNAKHTVFGHVLSGKDVLRTIASVKTDRNDKPLEDVLISNCGELEKRKKQPQPQQQQPGQVANSPNATGNRDASASSASRGRHKQRHSSSLSRSRSASPSRGHHRTSGSRHRHTDRHGLRREDSSSQRSTSRTPPPASGIEKRNRRRSDASPDHTLRGRMRNRSPRGPLREEEPMRTRRTTPEVDGATAEQQHYHNRRRSKSRSRPRSASPDHRRQKSLPNVYGRYRGRERDRERERGDGTPMEVDGEQRYKRGGNERYYDRRREDHGRLGGGDRSGRLEDGGGYGRLGGGGDYDGYGGGSGSGDGVIYKGRGSMKFREQASGKRRW